MSFLEKGNTFVIVETYQLSFRAFMCAGDLFIFSAKGSPLVSYLNIILFINL
jgi:hypothetical protein